MFISDDIKLVVCNSLTTDPCGLHGTTFRMSACTNGTHSDLKSPYPWSTHLIIPSHPLPYALLVAAGTRGFSSVYTIIYSCVPNCKGGGDFQKSLLFTKSSLSCMTPPKCPSCSFSYTDCLKNAICTL